MNSCYRNFVSCHALLFKYRSHNSVKRNIVYKIQPAMSANSQKSDPSNASNSDDEEEYENETFEEESQDEDSFEELSLSTLEKLKDGHKPKSLPNKTFTSAQIREIERENSILMGKILTYSRKPNRPKLPTLPNKYHVTSAAINRKKNQMKIDWENQILLKKIQSVKSSIKY